MKKIIMRVEKIIKHTVLHTHLKNENNTKMDYLTNNNINNSRYVCV